MYFGLSLLVKKYYSIDIKRSQQQYIPVIYSADYYYVARQKKALDDVITCDRTMIT